MPLTVGGGISVEDINKLLNCGADGSINTAAVENSKVVVDSSKKFGSQYCSSNRCKKEWR